MRPNVWKAIIGGFVATVVLTLIMYYVAPLMLPGPMDVAGMLGGLLGVSATIGMIIHFINGTIIFPLIYIYLLYQVLPGAPWLKGLWWGLILWLLAELTFVPLAGGGVFHGGNIMPIMGSLIGHAVYGILLGAIAGGPQVTPTRAH